MDIIAITSLVVGLVSFAVSIVFFLIGARTERHNQEILNCINAAIKSWQTEIMTSSIELLNSRVEIVGKKVVLEDAKAKHEFLAQVSERIKYIIENPAPNDLGPTQSHNLKLLFECFENATKSSLPPEVLANMFIPPVSKS